MADVDYVLLKMEIVKPAYAGMTDAQIAASINSQTYAVAQDILSLDAINSLIFTTNGDWAGVVQVADGITNTTAGNRKMCISVKELFARNQVFDATDDTKWTRFISTVDSLITAGFMTTEGKNLLIALRTRNDPLWKKFGTRTLDYNDIVLARAA